MNQVDYLSFKGNSNALVSLTFYNVFTFCMILSPLPFIFKIIKEKDVGDFCIYPYFVMMIRCFIVSLYFLGIEDIRAWNSIVNLFGVLASIALVILYYKYSRESGVRKRIVFSSVAIFTLMVSFVIIYFLVIYNTNEYHYDIHDQLSGAGIFAIIVDAGMVIAPTPFMYSMYRNTKARSIEWHLFLFTTSIGLMGLSSFIFYFCWGLGVYFFYSGLVFMSITFIQITLYLAIVYSKKHQNGNKNNTEKEPNEKIKHGLSNIVISV
ncbi:hypothetical protein CYY_009268 [Polysphondylium violaceum]|uniref:Uncharacterized protein n=1 Tax=Polysphondylium violaceum TaxID=133409 RepID=A0A8J4PN35_9MYCE|nr:hypothetical protein CYY_009268 [Polysphondylium violaceum]